MTEKLPLTYKPRSLRPKEQPSVREVRFSIGILGFGGVIKFTNGPLADVMELLDIVPESIQDYVIVRHNPDSTDDIIYGWNHANSCWYLLDHSDS